ncbi:HTH-type transcriptional regulator DmlR [mine drainage metagenome]|uniref:HTH-type transcriptional regulator DmlR n=1 Tax=mine drainage metagenome TaxID=410659 RepID=A0A1J5QRH6_9ZZZZ
MNTPNEIDWNDLRYFALVVDAGGFAAAERKTGATKSKLSRRVAELEAALGVQLLRRSTRRVILTEPGRALYRHCAALCVEADAALDAVEQLRSEPAGTVRVSCPTLMAQISVAELLARFLRAHPKVRVELDASDRIVDLLAERVDVALRAAPERQLDPNLVARRLSGGHWVLVASRGHLHDHRVSDADDTLAWNTIGSLDAGPEQEWELCGPDGVNRRLPHRPRLLCADIMSRMAAVRAGAGIGLLPERAVRAEMLAGTLVRVLPGWSTAEQGIHLIYSRRREMIPAVSSLVDFLSENVALAFSGASGLAPPTRAPGPSTPPST